GEGVRAIVVLSVRELLHLLKQQVLISPETKKTALDERFQVFNPFSLFRSACAAIGLTFVKYNFSFASLSRSCRYISNPTPIVSTPKIRGLYWRISSTACSSALCAGHFFAHT